MEPEEDELERLYSAWLAGFPPPYSEVMQAIGEYLNRA